MSTILVWEGNRRSGVALAMRHRHSGLSTYGLNGLCKGDEPTLLRSLALIYLNLPFYNVVGVHLLAVRCRVQSGAVHAACCAQFAVDPGDEASCRASPNEPRYRRPTSQVVVGLGRRRRRRSYDADARRRRPVIRADRAAAGRARPGQRRRPARLRQRLRATRRRLGRPGTRQQFGQLHSLLLDECAVQIDFQERVQRRL